MIGCIAGMFFWSSIDAGPIVDMKDCWRDMAGPTSLAVSTAAFIAFLAQARSADPAQFHGITPNVRPNPDTARRMLHPFASLDAARAAFDAYAALEPKLTELWDACLLAAPPERADDDEDLFDTDPFELDDVDATDDGWCAEDYFFEHVKSPLMLLVGLQRPSGPDELRTTRAYDTVYAALLDWALHRPCACCRGDTEVEQPTPSLHDTAHE